MAVTRSSRSLGTGIYAFPHNEDSQPSPRSSGLRYLDFVIRMRLVPRLLEYQWVPMNVASESQVKNANCGNLVSTRKVAAWCLVVCALVGFADGARDNLCHDQPYPISLIFVAIICFGMSVVCAVVLVPPLNGILTETAKNRHGGRHSCGNIQSDHTFVMSRYQSRLSGDLEQLVLDTARKLILRAIYLQAWRSKKPYSRKCSSFTSMLTAAHLFYYTIRQL